MKIAWLLALPFLGCAGAAPPTVGTPSRELVERLRLDPFYRKCLFAGELPIVSSEKVADVALLEARYVVLEMVAHRPELLRALAASRVRLAVMACDEMTTQIPEHRDLTPRKFWDRRARGLGATPERPAVSCGEENLVGHPGDPYATENILVHEFGHAIHEMGMVALDATFDGRLAAAFAAAMEAGLWKGKYAATNRQEYWAEGAQSWFDTNRENDDDHNHVDTRTELKAYDPALAKLLEGVFGDRAWRYIRPADRRDPAHFQGFDRNSKTFAWPE